MPADEALRHRRAERRRVVLVRHAAVAGARIVGARLVVARPAARRSSDACGCWPLPASPRRPRPLEGAAAAPAAAPAAAGAGLADERQLDFHLGVLREVLRHRHVDRAAVRLEPIRAGLQPAGHLGRIAHEELGGVDQQPVAARRGDREAPDDRPREPVAHRLELRPGWSVSGAVLDSWAVPPEYADRRVRS